MNLKDVKAGLSGATHYIKKIPLIGGLVRNA